MRKTIDAKIRLLMAIDIICLFFLSIEVPIVAKRIGARPIYKAFDGYENGNK